MTASVSPAEPAVTTGFRLWACERRKLFCLAVNGIGLDISFCCQKEAGKYSSDVIVRVASVY